jgi:hypothetical protein
VSHRTAAVGGDRLEETGGVIVLPSVSKMINSSWRRQVEGDRREETGGMIVVPSVSQRIDSGWRRQVRGDRQHNLQSAYWQVE